jgi:ribosome-associated protein
VEKDIKEIALLAAEAAEDKKAKAVKILEVKDLTSIADYFVICSGNSETQVNAIANGIEEDLKEKDIVPQKIAGSQESQWILLDYADIIIHVFHKDKRKYYEIERLWADAKEILDRTEIQK